MLSPLGVQSWLFLVRCLGAFRGQYLFKSFHTFAQHFLKYFKNLDDNINITFSFVQFSFPLVPLYIPLCHVHFKLSCFKIPFYMLHVTLSFPFSLFLSLSPFLFPFPFPLSLFSFPFS